MTGTKRARIPQLEVSPDCRSWTTDSGDGSLGVPAGAVPIDADSEWVTLRLALAPEPLPR